VDLPWCRVVVVVVVDVVGGRGERVLVGGGNGDGSIIAEVPTFMDTDSNYLKKLV
jgi:hypothetical protein